MKGRGYWILPAIISVLALADGALHLSLDFVLFRGRLWGSPSFGGARPGGAPRAGTAAPATRAVARPAAPPAGRVGVPPTPLPFVSLPLNELFLLNFIGFVGLVALFWLMLWRFGRWAWAVAAPLTLYTAATLVGWVRIGMPNPQGLGHVAVGLEVALLVVLLAHLGYQAGLGLTRRAVRVRPA